MSAASHLRFVATSPVSALLFSDNCPSLIWSCRAGTQVSAALHLPFVATAPVSALLSSDVCSSLISSCRAGSTLGKTQVVWFDRLSYYFVARDLLVCCFMNTIIITLIKSDSRQGGLRGSSWLVRSSMNFNAYCSIAYTFLFQAAVGQSWCCSIGSLLSSTPPGPKQGPKNSHEKTYHYKRLVTSRHSFTTEFFDWDDRP